MPSIQFTRGRPYKKDDNAHIEQKNWTHARRQLGYMRYDTEAARNAMNDLAGKEEILQQPGEVYDPVSTDPVHGQCAGYLI